MYRDKASLGQDATVVQKSKTKFREPLKWRKSKVIFTCSWSDWFIEEADAWRDEAWDVIRKTPQHTYQILTKRPERIAEHLPDYLGELKNVWLGVSVESQNQVDRIPFLQGLPCTTFVSFEPLIGEIIWEDTMNFLDWCIIGGESGNESGKFQYRPMEIEWAKTLIKGATENNVKCFVKQLGTFQSKKLKLKDRHGGEISEWEKSLQIREFPEYTPAPAFELFPM